MKSCFIVFIIVLYCTKLSAQDTLHADTAYKLEEVTVAYQAGKATPVTFQNISGREITAKSIGQEPSFLLSETPSVTVYSDAGSMQGYSYFRMRGIDQTRINISLDGIPLNEPEDQGAYFSNYPDVLNSVSSLQIQRGVGLSKNGVASYGGSVQLLSPDLRDSAYTAIGVNYGSFGSARAYGEYNSGVKNNTAVYVRGSEIYSDGYKDHSYNHSQSAFASAALFHPKMMWKLTALAGHQHNGLAWLGVPDSLIRIDRKTNANKGENDNFTQCLLHLQNGARISSSSQLQSSLYYTYLNGNYDFNLNGFLGLPSTSELYNYAFLSHLAGFFTNYTYTRGHISWTTGLHANTYMRRHTGSERTAGDLYQNKGFRNEFSAFTRAEIRYRPFVLYGDVQYRYSSFRYEGSVPFHKLDWQFLNPKAGISVEAGRNTTLYYSIGATGREPTRNDIFGGTDDLLADSTGKPLIYTTTAEHVTDHELGIRHRWKREMFNLNFYYMNFNNEIVLNGQFGPNGLALTDKVDRSYRTGIELTASYEAGKHLSLINNSSLNRSRIKEQKEEFTPILTPAFIINQEVIYHQSDWLFSLSGRYQDRSYIDFANTATIKPYVLINVRAEYSMKRWRLALYVNNITNAKYFTNGYIDTDGKGKYFVQAPASVFVSATYHL